MLEYPGDQNSVSLEMVQANLEMIHDPLAIWQASAVKNGMFVGLAHPLQTGKNSGGQFDHGEDRHPGINIG